MLKIRINASQHYWPLKGDDSTIPVMETVLAGARVLASVVAFYSWFYSCVVDHK